jgi:hypothetical protein
MCGFYAGHPLTLCCHSLKQEAEHIHTLNLGVATLPAPVSIQPPTPHATLALTCFSRFSNLFHVRSCPWAKSFVTPAIFTFALTTGHIKSSVFVLMPRWLQKGLFQCPLQTASNKNSIKHLLIHWTDINILWPFGDSIECVWLPVSGIPTSYVLNVCKQMGHFSESSSLLLSAQGTASPDVDRNAASQGQICSCRWLFAVYQYQLLVVLSE